MKTIKEGKIPTPPKPWWVGQRATCPHCKTVVEFEEGDVVKSNAERHPHGKRWVRYTCPFCGREENHDEVVMRGEEVSMALAELGAKTFFRRFPEQPVV